jgi:hypothetical protein
MEDSFPVGDGGEGRENTPTNDQSVPRAFGREMSISGAGVEF